MGSMINYFNVFIAHLKCNLYCMYHILRHLSPAQELVCYDKNNKVILIASTKDIVWGKKLLDSNITIDKVFYKADLNVI